MSREIASVNDPDDPRPWFDFRVSTDLWCDVFEANGVAAAAWTNADEQAEQAIKDDSRHNLSLSSTLSDQVHVLAVDADGDLIFVPRDEQPAVLYAHLAWYDPGVGEWDRLTFVEEGV